MAASEYLLEPLRQGVEFTLYRGRQRGNPAPLLVAAPSAERPLAQTLRRLGHEYSLAAELEPAWAVKPLALTRHEGRMILVLADPGGELLDRMLARLDRSKEQPLDLARVLRVAIGIAEALGYAHQRGLIHKDIKPENVLVDDSGHVWLTGFGLASRLPRERQAPAPPEIIAGTLAYMSPEQTGRMNRSIDARSDLYSLGVTLYQMLTGALPFAAADPLEWVHCHIARLAVAPADRSALPEALSAITMKLLAKNAEERYQTAAGLEADLRRCLAEWGSNGRIDPFPLGTGDWSDRLLIPEKLYGREREVDALLAAFDHVVAQGAAELVLVSGYSGVGKSSVVNELHKVLVSPRGLFAAGKFDQYKRDVPYATLAQAFQMLVRQILVKSEAEVDRWRRALLEALGPNGQLMVNLIPEVEFVIGKQPPVAELPPQEARGRFQLVFRRFLGAFASPEHPLALFLDDLQWLDMATLELLERLVTDPDVRHVLLIGAYRDNEVSSSHPLMRTLASIRSTGARVQEIVLAPPGLDDVDRLVADALHRGPESAGTLALTVYEKTGGNPFFAIQFLLALAEEGLLRFDRDAAAWIWESDRIRAKGYSDNIVDLMVAKLRRLSGTTQAVLQKLSCLGNVADIATLSMVFGQSEESIQSEFLNAARTGLILRLEGSYAFLHDRVQEAAYSLIPQELRAETHLRIGMSMASRISPGGLEERIFEVVNQLNRGSHLISSIADLERIAELNLIAGRRAKISTAYASALKYLRVGQRLLTEEAWSHNHRLIFSIESLLAECELLTADMAGAENRLSMLAERAKTAREIALVTRLRLTLYTALGRSDRAVEVFVEFQRAQGKGWSPHPTDHEVSREYSRIWSLLGARQIEELVDLPAITNPDVLDLLDVFMEVVTPALFTDGKFLALVICRVVNLGLEYGNCDGTCFAYVWLAVLAGPHFGNHQAGLRFARLGYDLVEKRGWHRYQARIYLSVGHLVMPWTQHVRTGRELMRRAFDAANRNGDLTYTAYSCNNLMTNLLAAGDSLAEVEREAESGLELARKIPFGIVIAVITAQLALVRTLRGVTAKVGSFSFGDFDELQFERDLSADPVLALPECWYWIRKLQARFFGGDYPAAIQASLNAKRLLWTSPSFFEVAEYHFYSALSLAVAFHSATEDSDQEQIAALADHHKQLGIWAENCPENFENRVALVGAEIARIEGRDLDAMRLYEQAIRSARTNGFVHNEALAYEIAAQFYAVRGFETIADAYLRNARNSFDRWGADGKVKQLDELYPRLRQERTSASAVVAEPPAQLDVESVVKVSQAISSEMVLPALIEQLLRIAVESAGAERGLLILLRGGEPWIEAQASPGAGKVEVVVRQEAVTPSDLPQSALHYVMRTRESVLLDDASANSVYSKDEYVRQKRARSVLCLPIVKQAKLVGALYLENNLTPFAFTPDRVTVLQLLASQAAISIENAGLYSDLQREGQSFRLIVDTVPGFLCTMTPRGQVEFVNRGILDYTGWTLEQLADWRPLLHPDERETVMTRWIHSVETGSPYHMEHRIFGADGVYRWFMVRGLPVRGAEGSIVRWYVLITDIDELRKTHEKLQRSEAFLAQGQRISHTGSFGRNVLSEKLYWSEETYRIYELDRSVEPTLGWLIHRIHPEDRVRVERTIESAVHERTGFDIEYRLLRPQRSICMLSFKRRRMPPESWNLWVPSRTSPPPRRRKRRSAKARRRPGNFSTCRRCTSANAGRMDTASTITRPLSTIWDLRLANGAMHRLTSWSIRRMPGAPWTSFRESSRMGCHLSTKRGSEERTGTIVGSTIAAIPCGMNKGESRGGMPRGPISTIANLPSKGSRKKTLRCGRKLTTPRCSRKLWEVLHPSKRCSPASPGSRRPTPAF
jgi:PAS domain S-box-containing protein